MFWLEGENGEQPPTMWSDENSDPASMCKNIASFASSLILGSVDDAACSVHEKPVETCNNCREVQKIVSTFQHHKHKPSCLKKKKIVTIAKDEGHGRLDGEATGEELLVPLCRYNFPKNPSDETLLLLPFPDDIDKKELKSAEVDHKKIRKFLLRMTQMDSFEDSDQWKNFCNMDFGTFLFEVGMYDEESFESSDTKAFEKAKQRYLTALRFDVKKSGYLLLRRMPKDIFTNNFNKYLINIHQANQDIQYITDEYAVAQYVLNYCTKNEAGTSELLKSINDEAIAIGEASADTIRKLAKALDKGREVGIQESVYRMLGLPMTKFSSVVKFVNTNHPERRDGLLKSELDEIGKSLISKFCIHQ